MKRQSQYNTGVQAQREGRGEGSQAAERIITDCTEGICTYFGILVQLCYEDSTWRHAMEETLKKFWLLLPTRVKGVGVSPALTPVLRLEHSPVRLCLNFSKFLFLQYCSLSDLPDALEISARKANFSRKDTILNMF